MVHYSESANEWGDTTSRACLSPNLHHSLGRWAQASRNSHTESGRGSRVSQKMSASSWSGMDWYMIFFEKCLKSVLELQGQTIEFTF